ncbi:Pimeloyl-ACP methyl ester carboxylesterase [Roseateles sp. YR242]|uniref:alpha/beta fold hydrolase n=1 Tax=Roseateles sp. YR242 TaxID=1855305 RepID=UPI0008AA9A03|nr:alpha/beta hydrolase [Roseateles sp. YR242]SEL00050.1 Pimeloyl-ACP methyl ester carboxylesterase [Roseateles sp. YR242]
MTAVVAQAALALTLAASAIAVTAAPAQAPAAPTYGPQLEGFTYPYPIQRFRFTSQQQALEMAYMDVPPKGEPNGRVAVLLHGKNFCGATWESTIQSLTGAGFRVIAPDQIGFCASSKPRGYQFSFAQLAANTHALLLSLNIPRATIIGHSIGGMLSLRYTLQYPQAVEQLVAVNPIGLEDWQGLGVPYATVDSLYQGELKTSFDSIKTYQQRYYYHGNWKPEYSRWVSMLAGLYAGPGRETFAWNQAQTTEMMFTQPVVHELDRIKVRTVLIIGQKDRTAPGATRASAELQQKLGDYPTLGRRAAQAIEGATLIELPERGHAPQMEAPEEFNAALLKGLGVSSN